MPDGGKEGRLSLDWWFMTVLIAASVIHVVHRKRERRMINVMHDNREYAWRAALEAAATKCDDIACEYLASASNGRASGAIDCRDAILKLMKSFK